MAYLAVFPALPLPPSHLGFFLPCLSCFLLQPLPPHLLPLAQDVAVTATLSVSYAIAVPSSTSAGAAQSLCASVAGQTPAALQGLLGNVAAVRECWKSHEHCHEHQHLSLLVGVPYVT